MSNSDAGEPDRTSGIGERHSFLGNNPGSSTESNSGPLTLQSYELRSFVWLVGSLFVRDAPQSSKLWGVTPRMGAWFRDMRDPVAEDPPLHIHFLRRGLGHRGQYGGAGEGECEKFQREILFLKLMIKCIGIIG